MPSSLDNMRKPTAALCGSDYTSQFPPKAQVKYISRFIKTPSESKTRAKLMLRLRRLLARASACTSSRKNVGNGFQTHNSQSLKTFGIYYRKSAKDVLTLM